MRHSPQQRRVQLLYRRLFMLGLVLVAALLVPAVWHAYEKQRETLQNRERAEERLAELENRQRELQEDISYLQSSRGVEAELRRQYAVAGPHEGVIVIVEQEPPAEETVENRRGLGAWFSSWWPF